MSLIVDFHTVTWTQEELDAGVAILQKMSFCQEGPEGLPVEIFEKFLQIKKNISTELVAFNTRGELFLRRRPSRAQNPSELFPRQWHSLGVTHGKNEYLRDTFARLKKQELGGGEIKNIAEVLPPVEAKDPQRGIYLCRVFVGETDDLPQDDTQRYFSEDTIPWEELVLSHRTVIIPQALAYRRLLVKSGIWQK